MFIYPVFDQVINRPKRWSFMVVDSGEFIQYPKIEENRFIHWTDKTVPRFRDVFTVSTNNSFSDFRTIRRQQIGFLTAFHREFYEDGKYVEVLNDPINYILNDPIDYDEAFDHAEKRIGNYRIGSRRYITHLGGTISADEVDMLKDADGNALTSFPLFPPKPPTNFLKPFRSHLISSDVGYIDYIKAAHPDEVTTSRYAYRSEQGTGFRRWIYDAGNSNMKYESTTVNSISKVDIDDLENIINTALGTAISGSTLSKKFLPDDGEDLVINFPGQNIIRSNKNGIHLEVYNNSSFTTLTSLIDIDTTTGDIFIGAGTRAIEVNNNGTIVIDDGTRSITLGTSNIIITDGTRSITMDGSVIAVT